MTATIKTASAALALTLMSSVSFAAEMPKQCGSDPRERCIDYRPGQIVTVILYPGMSTTIELPEGETVFFLGASDNSVITSEQAAPRKGVSAETTGDPNLETSVPGGDNPGRFVMLKAKRELAAQPFVVIGTWTHPVTGQKIHRRHIFELHTKTRPRPNGGMVQVGLETSPEISSDAFFSVVFSDPVARREIRNAERAKALAEEEARTVSDRLDQIQTSTLKRNIYYLGQGTDQDKVALAPSAPPGLDAIWDDGQRTHLRYPGNRGSPRVYQVLPDGTEATIGQNTVFDPDTNGSLVIVHQVVPMMRIRDGDSVLCITNMAYDPVGHNPGTGTVDPGIVRDVRGR
jgi:type IV secretion system protein VirB9